MLCHIDIGKSDAEGPRNVSSGPFLEHEQVENLELLEAELLFDTFERGVKKAFAPLDFKKRSIIRFNWGRH